MRVVLQRVKRCSVEIDQKEKKSIRNGLLVLLGIEESDTREDVAWLVKKIVNLRIFSDEEGKMNLSVEDINGELMVISQFTLFASTKKGNRPSYIRSAKPEVAIPLYESFLSELRSQTALHVEEGKFGSDMQLMIHNDGPVTIIIDSKDKQ